MRHQRTEDELNGYFLITDYWSREMMDGGNNNSTSKKKGGSTAESSSSASIDGNFSSSNIGKALIALVCGTLVYYHCAYRNSSLVSLMSDVLIVLLCSLAILGLLFRQLNIQVPVDPLEWQISQDTANSVIAWLANTIGAAESVLRVAATGHDKRLFFKVVVCLYVLSALGRLVSGVTVAYAALCLFCFYMLAENSQSSNTCISWLLRRGNGTSADSDGI